MKIKILDETKKRIEFEIEGENHTLCNILREVLWEDSHVKTAVYRMGHPLVKLPRMLVETDGSETPREALVKAAKSVLKLNESFSKAFEKAVKK